MVVKKSREIKKLEKKEKELDEKIEKLSRLQKIRLEAKQKSSKFKSEFKKSINTALVAAFGFLIALSWRSVITDLIESIESFSPVQGKLVEAIIVTIVGVIGIMTVTSFLSEKE
jgi:hypothetical protein